MTRASVFAPNLLRGTHALITGGALASALDVQGNSVL